MHFRQLRRTALILATALLCSGLAFAADRYIETDDYEDGEEVVGEFFGDEEYSKIVDDIERNDIEFDWGWVKHQSKKDHKPKNLAFSLADYDSIRIAQPENHALELLEGIEEEVQSYFVRAFEREDFTVVTDPGAEADLFLDMAIVDLKSGETSVGWIDIDPFLELEIEITDTATGETLMLVRHQAHSSKPAVAAGRMAGEIVRFLE
ncbi:MAG: hypothetical protein R3234_11280 [Thermoanaerobaculia bacterium]|nr:hypothetical protein [Thermoanaerobaculia bacterium]